ncbi:hypothetical protein ACSSVY_002009 [Roseovarius sp. MBR-51]
MTMKRKSVRTYASLLGANENGSNHSSLLVDC